jgi:membrane protein YqaA with SNARE-associated domain
VGEFDHLQQGFDFLPNLFFVHHASPLFNKNNEAANLHPDKLWNKVFQPFVFSSGSVMITTMSEFLTTYGLWSLFFISFCASTLLPLGSEWLLVALLLQGSNPVATVAVATIGNSLGSGTNYLIGFYGGDWLKGKVLRIDKNRQQQAEKWFNRYGSWSLLLAWLPIIGDPLCLVAGMLRTPLIRFSLLVTTGKGLRYSLLTVLTLQGSAILTQSGAI